jgi:hypothetical protein
LLAGAALAPLPSAPQVRMRAVSRNGPALVETSGYTGTVSVVTSPSIARFDDIAYFWDARYAHGHGESDRFAHGFLDHLDDALLSRAYRAHTRVVNARDLRALLAAPPGRTCLLVLGGILPDTVRSSARDALRSWLLAGGTVIWAGMPFDAVYSDGRGLRAAVFTDYTKWSRLYRVGGGLLVPSSIFAPDAAFATEESRGWRAMRAPYVRTTFGVYPERLPDGFAIGYTALDGRSSVTVFSPGKGHVVLFAEGIEDESFAAEDVAQILFTNLWADRRVPDVTDVAARAEGAFAELPPGTRYAAAFGWGEHDGPFASLDLSAPSE